MAVTLPFDCIPNGVSASLIDYGAIQRPATGGASQRIDRAGSRFRFELSFPPMPNATKGRVVLSRLLRAKADGLQIEMPLLDTPQGAPGSPVVDGAGQSGTTLLVRGCTAGYLAKEGFWLSISNGTRSYMHNVAETARADGSGDLELLVTPALRYPFADGAAINLADPIIDGFVVGEELGWQMDINRHLGLSVTVEEWG